MNTTLKLSLPSVAMAATILYPANRTDVARESLEEIYLSNGAYLHKRWDIYMGSLSNRELPSIKTLDIHISTATLLLLKAE